MSVTMRVLAQAVTGVADRCQVEAGSFFESIPEHGDAYVVKHVLVDWEDEDALAILRACQRVIGADQRLLVIEWVITQDRDSAAAKLLDLSMLVSPGGKVRTRDEWTALFTAAGFRLSNIYPTSAGEYVIEGIPRSSGSTSSGIQARMIADQGTYSVSPQKERS